jgi:hypothetical protein
MESRGYSDYLDIGLLEFIWVLACLPVGRGPVGRNLLVGTYFPFSKVWATTNR